MFSFRCDSGIEEGSEISIYYDPMICKLVAYGKDRSEAIARSIKALDNYVIRGVTHNIPLLRDILTERKFRTGDISTNYLPEVYPEGFKGKQLGKDEKSKLLAITSVFYATREVRSRKYLNGPKTRIRESETESWDLVLGLLEEDMEVYVTWSKGNYNVQVGDQVYLIDGDINLSSTVQKTSVNGETTTVQLQAKDASGYFDVK